MRAGRLKAPMTPRNTMSTSNISMVINPAKVRTVRITAWKSASAWVNLSRRRKSMRSVTAPAMGPTTTLGKSSAKAISPSHAAESVSCQVSQPTPTRWIQVPRFEHRCPAV